MWNHNEMHSIDSLFLLVFRTKSAYIVLAEVANENIIKNASLHQTRRMYRLMLLKPGENNSQKAQKRLCC